MVDEISKRTVTQEQSELRKKLRVNSPLGQKWQRNTTWKGCLVLGWEESGGSQFKFCSAQESENVSALGSLLQ